MPDETDDAATPSSVASAAPRRTPGARTRAGNNMTRARAGILNGAAICVARYGSRKTTMADIAREGGVAKATLYNHFRTKDDVYASLVAAEVDGLLADLQTIEAPAGSADAVAEAAARAALWIGQHKALRHLSRHEPELVARLTVPGKNAVWRTARQSALEIVTLAQAAGSLHPQHEGADLADTILRWVLSHALWPADEATVRSGANRLVRGLLAPPLAPPIAAPAAPVVEATPTAEVANAETA